MKKILSLILFLSILFFGCVQNQQPESDNIAALTSPPELTVTVENKEIYAVLGSYSWTIDNGDGTATSIDSESAAPPELSKSQKESLSVKPESTIILNFANEPTDYIVSIWKGNNQSTVEVINSEIITPQQKGLIVYEVFAKWNEGNAYYAFSLKID